MRNKKSIQLVSMFLLLSYTLLTACSCVFEFGLEDMVPVTLSSYNSRYGYTSGDGTYNVDSQVTITATPYSGYRFVRWSDYNTSSSRTITVSSSGNTYTAYFERITVSTASITLNTNSSSYGYTSGGGTYYVGSSATIIAIPYSGYRFVRWSDYNTSSRRTITVSSSGNTYTAYFERITVSTASITLNTNYSSYGYTSGGGTYYVGSSATIIAIPYSGYRFVKWNDYNTSSSRTITVSSSGNTYTAYFERNTASLTINTNSSSYGYTIGGGTYDVGSNVRITAIPYSGYRFVMWNDSGTSASRVFQVSSSGNTYTAYFERSNTIIFNETFESSSWKYNTTSYAGSWDNSVYNYSSWDRTSIMNYSGYYCVGANGSRTSYSDNTISELKRTVNLTNFSNATLSFYEKINTESYYDYLKIYVVTDSGSAYEIYSKSGNTSGWSLKTVSLNSYHGQRVTLIFEFFSDSNSKPSGIAGVWLDNIALTAY